MWAESPGLANPERADLDASKVKGRKNLDPATTFRFGSRLPLMSPRLRGELDCKPRESRLDNLNNLSGESPSVYMRVRTEWPKTKSGEFKSPESLTTQAKIVKL
jgi:hypothetical protein